MQPTYRQHQRLRVDRGTGALILRFHLTDVVTIQADGSIYLDTGGYNTYTTRLTMNDVLAGIDVCVSALPGGCVWRVADLQNGCSYEYCQDRMVILAQSSDDAARAGRCHAAYLALMRPTAPRIPDLPVPRASLPATGESDLCVLCASAERDTLTLPCVHMVMCGDYSVAQQSTQLQQSCPCCTEPIATRVTRAEPLHAQAQIVRQAYPVQPPPSKQLVSAQAQARELEEMVCVVCMDNERDHVLVPCGHLALCGRCCDLVLHPRVGADAAACPLCRCGIQGTIQLGV